MFFFGTSFCADHVFYSHGSKNVKQVALTFDDGPGASTLKVLEILKEKGVKATFFMLGIQARRNPNDSKRVAQDGHEIGTHTYGHMNFYAYKSEDKPEVLESELVSSVEIIEQNTGVKPFLARFPYGYSGTDTFELAQKRGFYVINWTFGCDWRQDIGVEEMLAEYLKALENGAIFLMHDAPKNAKILSFLADFIDAVRKEGYEIVTVSRLLGLTDKKGGTDGKHFNSVGRAEK
jgi:peptidoglycan/xylan/chitin deacetylase (PgdA/CDA1 family)